MATDIRVVKAWGQGKEEVGVGWAGSMGQKGGHM